MSKKTLRAFGIAFFFTTLIAQVAMAAEKAQQAQNKMIATCQQEYPDQAKNMTLDQLDSWAEAEEHSTRAAEFKKSACFKSHEKWEKLAQRNEWAKHDRIPASSK